LCCFEPDYHFSILVKDNKTIKKIYTDKASGGNSLCVLLENNEDILIYRYRRGTKIEYPYTGVNLYLRDTSLFDFSNYTHMVLNMKADNGQRIPFYMSSYIDRYSKWNAPNTFIPAQFILNISDTYSKVEINLSDYKIPNWWYGINDKSMKEIRSVDFSQIGYLNFQDCNLVEHGETDTVYIKDILFYKSLKYHVWGTVIFIILYFCIMFLVIESRKRNKKLKELIAKNPIKVNTKINKEKEINQGNLSVFKYIEENYSNPDLTIVEVEKRTGVAERNISQMIKTTTDLNFKQFLNYLRITEAKQLLTETDMRISEIAFKTGYNNVSHFNRVFKNMVNTFPSDYRESSRIES